MVAKAYSYIRFSTPGQAKGDSLRRQLRKSEKFAEERGLELDTSHRDLGVSAFKGAHRHKGALGAFLKRVEEGEIAKGSWLIVENLDRLTREQVLDAVTLFLSIIRAGVIVATLSDDMVYSEQSIIDRPNDLIISISAFIKANKEQRDKGDRVREAMDSKREDLATNTRKKFTRQGPSWLTLVADDPSDPLTGEWQLNARAADVRRLFVLARDGLGREMIARTMQSEGVPPLRHGDGWHPSTVLTLLRDRRTIGELQLHSKRDGKRTPLGQPIKDYFPPVVEEELFYAVQRALSTRHSGATPGKAGKLPNLFRGIGRCTCGRAMEYRDKSGPRNRTARNIYLMCSGARRSDRLCQNDHHFTYSVLEATVLDWITDIEISDQQANSATIAAMKLAGKEAERDDLERRIRRVTDAWEREEDEAMAADLNARIRANRASLATVNAEIEALAVLVQTTKRSIIDDKRAAVKRVREELGTLKGDQLFLLRAKLAAALRAVVESVTFHADGRFVVALHGGLKTHLFAGNQLIGTLAVADPKAAKLMMEPNEAGRLVYA